jgi:flagellar basal body-associated protein FliL
MMTFSLVALIIVILLGLLVLLSIGVMVYVIWLLNKTMTRVNRIDALEAEVKSLQDQMREQGGGNPISNKM